MQARHVRPASLGLALGLLIGTIACGASVNRIGPENQVEVTNATDQFQFQVTALDDVTDARNYEWENTGPRATIDISQAIASGAASLTISDASGSVMYDSDIAEDDDATTPEGTPGTWQITIILVNVTGTFNFRVQKTT